MEGGKDVEVILYNNPWYGEGAKDVYVNGKFVMIYEPAKMLSVVGAEPLEEVLKEALK